MSRKFKIIFVKCLHPTSQMAFGVSVSALALAGIGAIVNHWVEGWMAIGGMVGIGFFYAVIGIVNQLNSIPEGESNSSVSRRIASANNLYAEDVTSPTTRTDLMPSDAHERNTGSDQRIRQSGPR